MKNECLEYAKGIAEELYEIDNGASEDYETLYDYLEGVLDIEVRASVNKKYQSALIAVTLGGPNAYIDTKSGTVKVYWGSDSAEYPIDKGVQNELDYYIRDYWKQE